LTSINEIFEAIHRIRADLNTLEVFLWGIRKSIEKSYLDALEVEKESDKTKVFVAGEDRPENSGSEE